MGEIALPGGTHGQIDVGYTTKLEGLERSGTVKGSMEWQLAATDLTATFETDGNGNGTGTLAGYIPLELHIRMWDDTTQVAGRWGHDVDGESNTTTIWGTVAASGWEIIPCFELFKDNKNIYLRVEAALSGTGRLDYKLVCARDRANA